MDGWILMIIGCWAFCMGTLYHSHLREQTKYLKEIRGMVEKGMKYFEIGEEHRH